MHLYPHRRQVCGRTQVPPETEGQLSNNRTVWSRLTGAAGASFRCFHVVERALAVATRKQRPTVIPLRRPTTGGAVPHEDTVERVSEYDFDSAEVFVERPADGGVPVVEVERGLHITAGRDRVRAQTLKRQVTGDNWRGIRA
jgi:hypothetical protein